MNKPTALIIEDDRDLANIFAEALQSGGFSTHIIRSGDTALAQLATMVPDVIVLDLHLPHVSGVEILRQVRADERLERARVIIATADPRMAESVEDQADLSLLKPISFSQLRDLAVRLSTSVQEGE